LKKKKRKKKPWSVYVAQLDPVVRSLPKLAELNLGAKDKTRCVHVGYVSTATLERFFSVGDFSSARNPKLKRYGIKILDEYTKRKSKEHGCQNLQNKLIRTLRTSGWFVINPIAEANCSVYVIELTSDVGDSSSEHQAASGDVASRGCVYVGQTADSPEERLEEHKAGGDLSARGVNIDTIVGLRPDLYEHLDPMTRLDALREECRLADQLKRKGWTVLGGH